MPDALLKQAYDELVHLFNGSAVIKIENFGAKDDRESPALPEVILFFSLSNVRDKACVISVAGSSFEEAWSKGVDKCHQAANNDELSIKWLRVDWVTNVRPMRQAQLDELLSRTKRNYFRYGISFSHNFEQALLEQELNANAILYGGSKIAHACLNNKNLVAYARKRFSEPLSFNINSDAILYVFSTNGRFYSRDSSINDLPGSSNKGIPLAGPGRNGGRRQPGPLNAEKVFSLVNRGASFLSRQVMPSGRFIYGYFPCFGRQISNYNTLRHASTTYSMLEAWELTQCNELKSAIDRALEYLANELIHTYSLSGTQQAAYLVDTGNEIKLGGNAVCLLAMVKYTELTGDERYLSLMESLATGIELMQDPGTGKLVHVLNAEDLSIKGHFRIIYYDGEAAFGLMRLYGITKNERWLTLVERAFDYFIDNKHWQAHDHWLSYCVNELTRYRPKEKYFRFAVNNISGYLDFIKSRRTTYPTLLELSMAFHHTLTRIKTMPEMQHLLQGFDEGEFYSALHARANYLMNGFFWPEFAMYFAKPDTILGSFFIRHHSFRVRIDDVEHYLSGYVAYWELLRSQKECKLLFPLSAKQEDDSVLLAWGGDVNLGRRQHYRTAELGASKILDIPALKESHLSIVNLESVVTIRGEQGADKSEGGPYYYRARPEMLEILGLAGVDVVSTANNHSGDYGSDGLLDQQRWLAAAGIEQIGSGINREAAFCPLIRRVGALRIAMIAVDSTQPHFAATETTAGTAYLPLNDIKSWQQMKPKIDKCRELADIVLVCVHWGDNHATSPSQAQVKAGHALIEAGADAVLGASAHRLQGVELYRQKPIIYDAGDLLFDAVRSSPKYGGLFQLELSRKGVVRIVFVPVEVGFGQSWQAKEGKAETILSLFNKRCQPFNTKFELSNNGTAVLEVKGGSENTCVALLPTKVFRPSPNLWGAVLDPAWTVEQVPDDAKIEPVTLGPFTLLGLKSGPRWIDERQMIWVESFWRIDTPVEEDWRLEVTAVPSWEKESPSWGRGMDHDFCDWLLPTSRWCSGVIYRDFYGIRPPLKKDWINTELNLQMRLITGSGAEQVCIRLPVYFGLGLPEKPEMRWPFIQQSYRSDFSWLSLKKEQKYSWDALQLQAVTGGRWITPPSDDWHVNSVIRARSHAAMLPSPTLYVASTSLDLAHHEQFSTIANCYRRRWDSHDVLSTLPAGVVGAVVSRPVANLPKTLPVLIVEDPIKALIEMGIAARQRLSCPLVAVTGSAGKTTLVSMIQQLLSEQMEVHTTYDNYNSRVGIFTVMASIPPSAQLVALEVAVSAINARQYQNIKLLAPDVAVITNIGPAHLRDGEDTASVAVRKSNLFRGVRRGGLAIVCRDTDHYDEIAARAKAEGLSLLTYGEHEQADYRLQAFDAKQGVVEADCQGDKLKYTLGMSGRHFAVNSLVCLILARHLGLPLQVITERCSSLKPIEGRGEALQLCVDGKQLTVLNDSYNANPLSMSVALQQVSDLNHSGRSLLLLGDMLELGQQAQQYHLELSPDIVKCSPEKVYLVGKHMQAVAEKLREQGIPCRWFELAGAVMSSLRQDLQEGDLLLVKSSNGTRLSEVVTALKNLSQPVSLKG
ncbi:CapA family protein [Oceanimonas baumannii]|uniref:UDP-N-acetylmuramoyl-tripeptide--D-alanyl-D-alanine ligase n=1 Tax=Oceanimonas baumannii TaxID=129578 RepID=A0ABY2F143_9GAMM|nr:CapA family protein [Oceanimonas baumannii]TDW60285.1 UDP-N-acetylmuramoyl-tripeptide--D-alanyl-D-alanine ligase [Oceanimonas baumannii]